MQKESIDAMVLAAQQQLYDYALQLRFSGPFTTDPYALFAFHQQYETRFREQPKPSHSYIGLIAMAILSSPERQLVLSDIYQWILDHYPYFRNRGLGWRNSIRHNLSLNDCFIKAGRSANGKGHYWCIHPANLSDFLNGDFRRRRAQRRVRKSLGLSAADDEEDEEIDETEHSPSKHHLYSSSTNSTIVHSDHHLSDVAIITRLSQSHHSNQTPRKRSFDVDSLLAPDHKRQKSYLNSPNFKSDRSTDTEISA